MWRELLSYMYGNACTFTRKAPVISVQFQSNFNASATGCETLHYAIERTFFRDHSAVSTVQVDRRVQRYS